MNVLSSPRNQTERDSSASGKPIIEQLAMAFGVGVPFIGLIAAIVHLWGSGLGWTQFLLLIGFYSFTILGVTIGYHRMFTHRALEAGPLLRFVLAVAGSMSAQGPVIEWCALHRAHHKFSDRDGDPHSPHLHGEGVWGLLKGMWYSHMGWLFSSDPAANPAAVGDLLADPVLLFVDGLFWVWMLAGWTIPGVIAGLVLHSWKGALSGVIWGGLVRTFLLHHVTWSINSVCHVWGDQPFGQRDHSRNNALFGILAFGEGWHNNHHAFPTSARHGLSWWQFDLTWWTINLLEKLRLVWNVRVPSTDAIHTRRVQPAGSRPLHNARSISLLTFAATAAVLTLFARIPQAAEKNPAQPGANLGNKRIFPANDQWNRDISADEIDPDSAALIASIGNNRPLHPDFGTVYDGAPCGIPYVVVDGRQPRVPIEFDIKDESDPGPYPIPPDAPIEGGPHSTGDRHVLVVDRDAWKLYELWSATPIDGGKSWKAGSGAIFDLKTDTQRPAGWTSADAAGLPILPGLVRYDEAVEKGSIEHALRFTIVHSRRAYVAPARHFASRSTDPHLPPMGMRVRLKASFDISGFPPSVKVILIALKKYGMIVADNGSNWYISGAPDPRWNDDDLGTLRRVKGKDFEVVKMNDVVTN